MIAARWLSFLIAVVALVSLGFVARSVTSMLLAVIFASAFIVFCATLGAFHRAPPDVAERDPDT